MVTGAVRRVNLDRSKESLLDYIDAKKYFLLPNTAGCYTAEEAIRTAKSLPSLHSPFWAPDAERTIQTGITAMTAAVMECLETKKAVSP